MPLLDYIYLDEALQYYAQEGARLFLLVEGAGSNPTAKNLLLQQYSDELLAVPLYLDTDYEPVVNVSPLFVPINTDSEYLRWFIANGPEQNAGILLATVYPPQVVLSHLRGMVEVRLPDYNYASFRYHDPRVVGRYVPAVGEQEQERLLGPLTAMIWPVRLSGPEGHEVWQWRALHAPLTIPDDDNPYLEPQPVIDITDEQLAAFEQDYYSKLAGRLHTMF